VCLVVVAYNPDPATLRRLLARLAPQVDHAILVDNSEDEDARDAIAAAASDSRAEVIRIGRNSGVAHAQNVGAERAIELGARYLLLSDDDSLPAPDMVERLLAAFSQAAASARVAAVGPCVFDGRAPDAVLVFRDTVLGPRRAALVPGTPRVLDAPFLVASGCLIDVDAWRAIGPMREELFIDHVDLEWGLRARRAGWTLIAVGDALLEHTLGERILRPWFLAGRGVHIHSPSRNYYLARNTLLLLREGALPAGWRFGYVLWLAKYVAFNVLFVAPRLRRLRLFGRAAADALAGRVGRLPI